MSDDIHSDPDIDAVIRLVNEQHAALATKDDLRRMSADFKRWLFLTAVLMVLGVSLTVGIWEKLHP